MGKIMMVLLTLVEKHAVGLQSLTKATKDLSISQEIHYGKLIR